MGWAFCGTDSKGREIGYGIPATCDHPECEEKVDRGISFACGGRHGEHEGYCEKYFCEEHHRNYVPDFHGGVCDDCYSFFPKCPHCETALKWNGECEERDNPYGPPHPETTAAI